MGFGVGQFYNKPSATIPAITANASEARHSRLPPCARTVIASAFYLVIRRHQMRAKRGNLVGGGDVGYRIATLMAMTNLVRVRPNPARHVACLGGVVSCSQ